MLEFALRALRANRSLQRIPLGVIAYADEGQDAQLSAALIRSAAQRAHAVLVLTPGNRGDRLVTARRGQRRYRLVVEGRPLRLGQHTRSAEVMQVLYPKLAAVSALSDRKTRIAIATVDLGTDAFPMRLPHRVRVMLQLSYPEAARADALDGAMREVLRGDGLQWDLAQVSDRPPMVDRRANAQLLERLRGIARDWEIPLEAEDSLWPSVAGLVPEQIPVLCGLAPVAQELHTSREAVSRMSLVQRTLLLAQFLLATREPRP